MSDTVKYGTATFVKNIPGMTGDMRLFRLDPPIQGDKPYDWETNTYGEPKTHEYAAVSAAHTYSGPETYIFASDSEGNITNWGELDGSYRGGLNHEKALRGAGYDTIVYNKP